jgi:hypothetical protein
VTVALETGFVGLRRVRQSQRGQRDAHEADTELLQRPAARDGLGQAFRQFIESVVHNFAFGFGLLVILCFHSLLQENRRNGCRESELFVAAAHGQSPAAS